MTSKTISPNILTSSGKLDSRAKPDGSAKMTVIRSDQFVNGYSPSFYAALDQSSDYCSNFYGTLGGRLVHAVDIKYNINDQTNAHLSMNLLGYYKELYIDYDLFIPANYYKTGTANNKLIRIWRDNYIDSASGLGQHVGASMWTSSVGDGSGKLRCDCAMEQVIDGTWSTSSRGTTDDLFIPIAEAGSWVHITVYVRVPTHAGDVSKNVGDGIIRIFKNGVVSCEITDLHTVGAGPQEFGNMYLMGWANAAYAEETHFYVTKLVLRGIQ